MKRIVFFGLLLCIFSCSKDCKKVPAKLFIGDIMIPDSEKTYLPYDGSETLIFVSNKGDTAILYGTGSIQYYTKERIEFFDKNATCPQKEVLRYETLAAEFNGTNPNFSHFKIEQFLGYGTSIFRFYYNNKMERIQDTYPYEWDGRMAYSFTQGTCINTPASILVSFRGQEVNACHQYVAGSGFPRMIYFKQFGIIGYRTDSNTTYMLQ